MTELCWICGNPADSREHKFKKTDVKRAGASWSLADRPSLLNNDGLRVIQGPGADNVKFGPVLCKPCNNARSQPWDRAYETFSDWICAAGADLMAMETLDFEEIFGATYEEDVLSLLKYVLKHFGCQLSDRDYTIPSDLATLLDRNDVAPFGISLARNRYWYTFDRAGTGICGNFSMFGNYSPSTDRVSAPYLSGLEVGCLDIVYRYGEFAAYPWEGPQFSSPIRTIKLGLVAQDAGHPHFYSELPPDAKGFTIGERKLLAPLLSPQQRAQLNAMPFLAPNTPAAERFNACIEVIYLLMDWFYPDIDREIIEDNLTAPEMNDLLQAFGLPAFRI